MTREHVVGHLDRRTNSSALNGRGCSRGWGINVTHDGHSPSPYRTGLIRALAPPAAAVDDDDDEEEDAADAEDDDAP